MPKNTASSSSCAMSSASTAVVSIVPPEALLSKWSSRKTCPLSLASCLARATLSANGSDSKEKSARAAQASVNSSSVIACAPAESPSVTTTTLSAASGTSARLNPEHAGGERDPRSEEHTSELQSLMRISYAVFCLKKKTQTKLQ